MKKASAISALLGFVTAEQLFGYEDEMPGQGQMMFGHPDEQPEGGRPQGELEPEKMFGHLDEMPQFGDDEHHPHHPHGEDGPRPHHPHHPRGHRGHHPHSQGHHEQHKKPELSMYGHRHEMPQMATDEEVPEKAAANGINPFSKYPTVYANPSFQENVDDTTKDHPEIKDKLAKVRNVGAATWIDSMANIQKMEPVLQGAQGKNEVVMFVIYDLPNRDCSAGASNGEITCKDATCADGLNTYKTQYVDKVVAVLKKYPSVPVVTIIEPDSLPNLATNMNFPKCQQGQNAYKQGVEYTLKQMATLPNVTSYLDAAHGGWLGWDNNLSKVMPIYKEVLQNAGGPQVIRGFATNTANYQPLGSSSSSDDPCRLKSQYNFAIDEIHFMQLFDQKATQFGLSNMYYITDTSRNGVTHMRGNCSNWCNIKNSGLGVRPTSQVSQYGFSKLDAVVWIKTPGESDGTTDTSGRFDQMCRSSDSYIPAPEAGQWFEDFFVMLVNNANPPLMPSSQFYEQGP